MKSPALTLCSDDFRRPEIRCGGAGTGEEPAAGADPEPGGALPGSGGSAAAAGSHRDFTGNLTPRRTHGPLRAASRVDEYDLITVCHFVLMSKP